MSKKYQTSIFMFTRDLRLEDNTTLISLLKMSDQVIPMIRTMSKRKRNKVEEITLDLAGNMGLIAKKCFPNAVQVVDRFHVQQLASEALQEMRIQYRWQAIDAENNAIEQAKLYKLNYSPEILENGDTLKQLLVRSRYLLYKWSGNWTFDQKERADILFVNANH
jgi:transposase